MTGKQGSSPESIVREIKRQTRRKFTAEEKVRDETMIMRRESNRMAMLEPLPNGVS